MRARKTLSAPRPRPRTNGDALRRAVNWILNDNIFRDLKLHGNVTWTAAGLARLAVFWVWNSESSLVAAAHP